MFSAILNAVGSVTNKWTKCNEIRSAEMYDFAQFAPFGNIDEINISVPEC